MFAWDYEQVFNLWIDINWDSSCIASNCVCPIGNHYMWQAWMRKKIESNGFMVDIKTLISIKACSTYDVIHMTSKGYENETWYVVS